METKTHPLPAAYKLPRTLSEVPGDIAVDCLRRIASPYCRADDETVLRACRGRIALKHLKSCDVAMSRNLAQRKQNHAINDLDDLDKFNRLCRKYEHLICWQDKLFNIALEDGDHHTRDMLTEYLEQQAVGGKKK